MARVHPGLPAVRRPEQLSVVQRFAQLISTVGHPMLLLPLAIGFALQDARPGEGALPLSVVLLSLLLVAGFVVRARARAEVTDLDVSKREQRPRLYVVSIFAVASSAFLLWWVGQPAQVWQGSLVAMGLLFASGVVNQLGLKASLHTSFGVYAAGVLGTRSLTLGAAALFLAALVGWSRTVLSRHTWPEVLAGLGLGLLSGLCLLQLPLQ